MIYLGIDPGDQVSGWVVYDGARKRVLASAKEMENTALRRLLAYDARHPFRSVDMMLVETFQPRGQPLYSQLVWTAIWTGRLIEAWELTESPWAFLYREKIKLKLCGRSNVKDQNVRAALVDRHGGEGAVGKKAKPGPLHGVAGHAWAALALCVAYDEGARSSPGRDAAAGKEAAQ